MAEEGKSEPLLPSQSRAAADTGGVGGGGFSWLTALGFGHLTFNSVMAIYRSNGDMFGVWALPTALTLLFSVKVAATMPAAVKALILLMAVATVSGSFYAFFMHWKRKVCPPKKGRERGAASPRDDMESSADTLAAAKPSLSKKPSPSFRLRNGSLNALCLDEMASELDLCDRNGDGEITLDEMASELDLCDRNGDGEITLDEMASALDLFDRNGDGDGKITLDELASKLNLFDRNGDGDDGKITLDELASKLDLFDRNGDGDGDGKITLDELASELDLFDRNGDGDGKITLDELASKLNLFDRNGDGDGNGKITLDELASKLNLFDRNGDGDGKITLDELASELDLFDRNGDREITLDEMASALDLFDCNGGGTITLHELASVLDALGLGADRSGLEAALGGYIPAVATVSGGFYAFFLHWKRKGFGLAALRWHLPQTAGGGISAHDPRDTAWSRARLIVDSGATGHAVGDILLLEGFVPYRPPLVATLADGSGVRILGIGRIQRGNFSIPDVSLVEGVHDGLISTPQLDALHGLVSCFGNGVCRIMEADGTEVGGAVLEEDGSYVLRFLEVPGTAQV